MTNDQTFIGRYRVVERIGQGGMGSLFLAHDPMIDRLVAVKVLREGLDNPALRERFRREARAAGRLRHPNIVTIFDVGDHEGQPFIAMEYLPGETLSELIRRKAPLSLSRKLALIEDVCDGLAYAHKSGIVHRDVKPANLMVDPDGGIKILDFGIVRIAESGMTQAGMVVGTLNYMSPEQVAGAQVDLRSDIFAVGSVAYELLSYRQAFPGALSDGILFRIMNAPPAPLEEGQFGAEICAIVMKALEKDPNKRYRDLLAMRKDIARARRKLPGEEDVHASPPEDTETVVLRVPAVHTSGTRRPAAAESRRAALIEAHLKEAQDAMAAGDHRKALSAAEEVIVLDPAHATAIEIMDRAHVALTREEVGGHLRRAREALAGGHLETAEEAVNQAAGPLGELKHAGELQDEIQALQNELGHARERQALIQAAIDRARKSLDSDAYESAIRASGEVLALENQNADALAIRTAARAALDRRAAEVVERAERQFASGDHAGALEMLTAAPSHEAIGEAIERLSRRAAELAAERAQAEAAREQLIQTLDELQDAAERHMAAGDLAGARASLARMLELGPREPAVAALGRKLDVRERAYADRKAQAAAALQRQDLEAVHAAIAEAKGVGGSDAEVEALVSRLADAEARAAREAETRAAFELARARAESLLDAGSLAAAADALKEADRLIRKDARVAELQRRLDAALAEERKRQAQIAQKLKEAGKLARKRDFAAALDAAAAVIALDPENAEALQIRTDVTEARRLAEAERVAEAARRENAARAAEAARVAREEAARTAQAQPAALPKQAPASPVPVRPPASRTPMYAGVGVAALIVVAAGVWALTGPSETTTPVQVSEAATSTAPEPAPAAPAPASGPDKEPEPPAATPPPTSGTKEPAPAATPEAPPKTGAADTLVTQAKLQIARGQRREALETLRQLQALQPNHAEGRGVLGQLLEQAMDGVRKNRQAAERNPAASATTAFTNGVERQQVGERMVKNRRPLAALPPLWEAADFFASAAATPVPAEPPPSVETKPPAQPESKPREEPPPAAPPTPTPVPVSPAPATPPEPKPVDETAAIRATLIAYQNAWTQRDVAALRRVWALTPQQTAAFSKQFEDAASIEFTLAVQNIVVTGPGRATATGRATQVIEPRGGGGRTTRTLGATFALEKRGGNWIIVTAQLPEIR